MIAPIAALLSRVLPLWRPLAIGVLVVVTLAGVYAKGRNDSTRAWEAKEAERQLAEAKRRVALQAQVDQLAGELSAFDREDVQDTLNLLYSCNLVGDREVSGKAIWWATEMPAGTTVDRVVLDVVLVNVRDEGPLSDQDLERILGVSEGLAACLLDELHAAGRIEPATRDARGTTLTWRVGVDNAADRRAW